MASPRRREGVGSPASDSTSEDLCGRAVPDRLAAPSEDTQDPDVPQRREETTPII